MKHNKIKTCLYLVGAALVVTASACALSSPGKSFYKGIRAMDFRTSVISSAQAQEVTPVNSAKANIDMDKIISENRARIDKEAEKFSPLEKIQRKNTPNPKNNTSAKSLCHPDCHPELVSGSRFRIESGMTNQILKQVQNDKYTSAKTSIRKSPAPKIKIIK